MYDNNHLIHALRSASVGRDDAHFADLPDGRDITYGALFAGAERIAAALVAAGLRPGDRLAVQLPKSIEVVQLYLGTVMAGGVFLPLNTAYTLREVTYFLADASPRIVVCPPENAADLARIAGDGLVLTLDGDGNGSLMERAAAHTGFDPVAREAHDLAAILYTSGTTGRSKGAMLSHDNLASNSLVLRDAWAFTKADVLIHALPIYHTHGLFVATNVSLLAGAQVIFQPRFDVDAVIAAIPRATALMGVPTFYTRLLDDTRLTAELTAKMRLFVSGSAPLLAQTHKVWEARTGHKILERYGMTETNMNTSNPYEGDRRPGTVGLPLPGVDLRITHDGAEVPPGEIGVLEVRGANVFQGYWQMPDKTAEDLRADGWFITGDLARIEADGYVTIIGREKDLIITGGFNVYPKEVEDVIDAIPGVLESAVIGVPHPDFGEAVVAVVARSDAALKEGQIAQGLADKLAKFKQPKAVILVDTLPRNAMGKVQKKALRETHARAFA